ncbi:MAG: trigger factor [Bacteroidia bacterium]|nr:MAG: trigger factor [Bacteroidia bacterium]PIE86460.1 MAG: trigger factor [Bacteroidia bacterium]
MNITRENIDELNAVLTLKVEKTDYEERVNNVLKNHRRKASLPGFRPGKVPMGIIKKMMGKAVLSEEVNKIINENLLKYIKEEKIKYLGQPLPKREQQNIDFENEEDFVVQFDLGLSPKVDLVLDKNIQFPYYKIQNDEEMSEKIIEKYRSQFGGNKILEIADEDSYLKGDIEELDDEGNKKEEGIETEGTLISLSVFKDEDEKNKFIGANVNEVIAFDLKKALPNPVELSQITGIEKEEIDKLSDKFQMTIREITKFEKAELNTELYDKIFGQGVVQTEEEFKTKISEKVEKELEITSEGKFSADVRKIFLEKINFELPNKFLKKWLIATNDSEKINEEMLEKDYPKIQEEIRWQVIKDKIAEDHEITIEPTELERGAEEFARMKFKEFGMDFEIPEEYIKNYAKELLINQENSAQKIYEIEVEKKILAKIKTLTSLEEKNVTLDEFKNIYEAEISEKETETEEVSNTTEDSGETKEA